MDYLERLKLRAVLRVMESVVAFAPGISVKHRLVLRTHLAVQRAVIEGDSEKAAIAMRAAIEAVEPGAFSRVDRWFGKGE